VLRDFLPPTCLAADLRTLDDDYQATDCTTFSVSESITAAQDAEQRSSQDPSTKDAAAGEQGSSQYAAMADGQAGEMVEGGGGKQKRTTQDALSTKADTQPLSGGSTTFSAVIGNCNFLNQKWVPNGYERCSCCCSCCYQIFHSLRHCRFSTGRSLMQLFTQSY